MKMASADESILERSIVELSSSHSAEEISSTFKGYRALVSRGCCKRKCIENIQFRHVLILQKNFRCQNQRDRRRFLIDFFNAQPDGPFGNFNFVIDGKVVCRKCWTFANDIKEAWYFNLLKEVRGGRNVPEGNYYGRGLSLPTVLAVSWLRRHASESGDYAPDEHKIFLSSCMNVTEMYSLYSSEMEDAEIPLVSYQTFARMWRSECPEIKLRPNSKFSKCGVCVMLRESSVNTRDASFRLWLKEMKMKHVQQQRGERESYYRHRKKASDMPTKYVSLIIDGMDQHKTNIPHFTVESKNYKSEFYKVHVTGAMSHGTRENFIFLDEMEWSHDSDQTMNVLLKTLWKVSQNGQLPPVLYLQMDNCWRENKNQYVLGLCALLVHYKILRKIRLSYLMVGHTHEDIDQKFSRIAEQLKSKDAATIDGLKELIRTSYKPAPEVSSIRYEYAIRDWMQPFLNTPRNHTKPHAFKFEYVDGKVMCFYRMWATDKSWQGAIDLLREIPIGIPPFVRPSFEKQIDLEEAHANIKTCVGKISIKQMENWEEFLETGRNLRKYWAAKDVFAHCTKNTWLLTEFGRYAESQQRKRMSADDVARQSHLTTLLRKETTIPLVKVAKRQERRKDDNDSIDVC